MSSACLFTDLCVCVCVCRVVCGWQLFGCVKYMCRILMCVCVCVCGIFVSKLLSHAPHIANTIIANVLLLLCRKCMHPIRWTIILTPIMRPVRVGNCRRHHRRWTCAQHSHFIFMCASAQCNALRCDAKSLSYGFRVWRIILCISWRDAQFGSSTSNSCSESNWLVNSCGQNDSNWDGRRSTLRGIIVR